MSAYFTTQLTREEAELLLVKLRIKELNALVTSQVSRLDNEYIAKQLETEFETFLIID